MKTLKQIVCPRVGAIAITMLMAILAVAFATQRAAAADYCYGKIIGHTPNSDPLLCNGLKADDIVCVPCPPGGPTCRGSYECTRRRTVISGVCQVTIDGQEGECSACPHGTRAAHGKLDPPKAWWRWGWSCRRA